MKLIDTKEASAMLRVPEGTLVGWRSRGIGPAYVKLGRNVSYDVAVLEEYIRRNTHVPSNTAKRNLRK